MSEARNKSVEIAVDRRGMIRWLLTICILLELAWVVLDYRVNYSRGTDLPMIRRMFNITREDSLASWFAITQTLLTALTAWAIWLVVRAGEAPRWRRLGWLVLAVFFSYMAIDDGATIHERIGSAYKAIQTERAQERDEDDDMDAEPPASATDKDGFRSYGWQIVYVPIFGVMGLVTMAFLWFELGSMRRRLVVAAVLGLMALAVGMDYIEGMKPDDSWNIYAAIAQSYDFEEYTRDQFRASELDTLIHFSKSVEETIESFSMTLIWIVFLAHLMRQSSEIRLRWRSPGGANEATRPAPG